MGRIGRLLGKPVVSIALVIGLAGAGFGLYWFQPWKLFVDETVNEALPGAPEQPQETAPEPAAPEAPAESADPGEPAEPSGPETLAEGAFISHEHATTGSVRILRLEDDSLVLRLEDLDTSNGPDLKVWITDAPVIEGTDGWGVFDDGRYVSAGKLKGNKGSQNYELPEGTDLAGLTSVSIWCERFSVSFGAAELAWTT